jgi:hypothetical protein
MTTVAKDHSYKFLNAQEISTIVITVLLLIMLYLLWWNLRLSPTIKDFQALASR